MKFIATAIVACALAGPAALCAPTTTPAATTTKPPATTAAPTPAFTLGTPKWVGSGCPNGTASIVQSADGKNISLLFTAFHAATTATSTRERKDCNLTVPVISKPHIKVGLFRDEYRFKAFVPYIAGYVPQPFNNDVSAMLDTKLSWAGKPGPGGGLYLGPGGGGGSSSDEIPTSEITWSRCGGSTVFGVNATVTAQNLLTNGTVGEEVWISFDTADPSDKVGMFFSFATKKC